MTDAASLVTSARVKLVLDQPFFGALALNLEVREDKSAPTAYTNGKVLGYNPEFINSLSKDELLGVIAHEVMHCASGHPWRRDAREPFRWNVACDMVINETLVQVGFKLPKGCVVCPAEFRGKSAEWIYERLPKELKCNISCGEVRDAESGPKDSKGNSTGPNEESWKRLVQQAANVAKAQGKLPATLERFAANAVRPKVDWRAQLRRWFQERQATDFTWTRPNKRYMASGMYLPVIEAEDALGGIAISQDTSGSMDAVAFAQGRAETEAVIRETHPEWVMLYFADAAVAKVERFERDEDIDWKPVGGGGTSFVPVIEAVNALVPRPVCLIYITDLMGGFPKGSEVPVLWVTTSDIEAPFGETIRIS